MKIGVSLKIDVTKIDKARLFKGQKGTYLDATAFIDLDNTDDYGNHGMIVQSVSKEEKDQGIQGAILGNSKIFYREGGQQQQANPAPQPSQPAEQIPMPDFNSPAEDDDIPF